jgi:uncharacterized damage-inducible protein DinB
MSTERRIGELLLPELETELAKVRQTLERVPEDQGAFKSQERSRTLASLAGHTADLVEFLERVLTGTEFDFGTEHRTPFSMVTSQGMLERFDESAAGAIEALKQTSDEAFGEEFRFLFNGRVVFAGFRYTAYRVNVLNHIIHHRAQVGVYLRLLGLPVPAVYGPSADESPKY